VLVCGTSQVLASHFGNVVQNVDLLPSHQDANPSVCAAFSVHHHHACLCLVRRRSQIKGGAHGTRHDQGLAVAPARPQNGPGHRARCSTAPRSTIPDATKVQGSWHQYCTLAVSQAARPLRSPYSAPSRHSCRFLALMFVCARDACQHLLPICHSSPGLSKHT